MYVILILICFILYILNIYKEPFSIVGYNESITPNNNIKSILDEETKILNIQFNNSFKDHIKFDTTRFILFNNSLPFPFTNQFQKLILSFIKSIPLIKNNNISLGDFNNIYYLDDTSGNRNFILNVNVQNHTNFTSRNIKVRLIIHNIDLFINSYTNDYMSSFNYNLLDKNLSILNIILDKNGYDDFNIKAIDNIDNNFYINNYLYLLDPFVTSNNDMIITDDMKSKFNKSLDSHNKNGLTNYIGSN